MKKLMLLGLFGICLGVAPSVQAQPVVFGVGVGPVYVGAPPVCAYGYYDYYPYACAPYGFYGPQWFAGGVFIGAGPWGHGFHGRPGYYARPGYSGRSGFRAAPAVRGPANYGRLGGGSRAGFARGAPARGGSRSGGRR